MRRELVVSFALAVGASSGGAYGASGDATGAPEVVRAASVSTPRIATRAEAATAWCGTASQSDRTPNAIAGNPVHWVYLVPSDGQDQLAAVASAMQADAEQIDGWWRGQDPTRTPRHDVTTFSCGTQLDVTIVRASRSGAQLAPLPGRFAALANTVEQAGLASPFTKVVAYYDGPSSDENVCGQGGSDSTGFGVAVVYYQACLGVSTAAVAAMPSPGARLVRWAGACSGAAACALTVTPGAAVSAFFAPASFRLTLAVSGKGTVRSARSGIACRPRCSSTFASYVPVRLTATAAKRWKLRSWSGACRGSRTTCTVPMSAVTKARATFVRA